MAAEKNAKIQTVTNNALSPLKIYVVAGEASGDALGGAVFARLREISSRPLEFYGVGGSSLMSLGLKSLFPMQELAVMGFLELIPHIPNILLRMNQTLEDIETVKPDLVVTIDAPGFNFRLGGKVKAKGFPIVHISAPTVWAWKPKRAKKIAGFLDHLLALFPFEPPYFLNEGLPCTFMGHPFVEKAHQARDREVFCKKYALNPKAPILCVLPGSRRGEIANHLTIFLDAIELLHQHNRKLQLVFPTLPHLEPLIKKALKERALPGLVVTNDDDRLDAMHSSDVALAASGTVSLELALLGVPMVVAYRGNPISAWIVKQLILIPYVSLPNIILQQHLIPELLQENCTSDHIYQTLHPMLSARSKALKEQKQAFQGLSELLMNQGVPPTLKAAEVLNDMLMNKSKEVAHEKSS